MLTTHAIIPPTSGCQSFAAPQKARHLGVRLRQRAAVNIPLSSITPCQKDLRKVLEASAHELLSCEPSGRSSAHLNVEQKLEKPERMHIAILCRNLTLDRWPNDI